MIIICDVLITLCFWCFSLFVMHRIFTSLDSETFILFGISKVLCFSSYSVCTAGLPLEQNTRKQFFKQSLRNNWSFRGSKSLNQKIILISFNWQLGAGLFWLLINTIVQPKNWLRNGNTYTQLVGLVPKLEHDIICLKTYVLVKNLSSLFLCLFLSTPMLISMIHAFQSFRFL